MKITHYTLTRRVVLPPEDDTNVLTPQQIKAMQQKMIAAIDRMVELTIYGGHAPPIDPSTVVSEQSVRKKLGEDA